jgi:hypothetical protein
MKILFNQDASGGGAPAAAPSSELQPSATADNGLRSTPNLNDAFSKLDDIFKPESNEPAEENNEENKQDNIDKKQEKTADKKDQNKVPDVDKKQETSQDKPQDNKPIKAASLRENYDLVKNKLSQAEAKLKEYEEKLKSPPKISEEEKKSYEEKVTASEKRRAELEEHMKFVDYSKSEEFKTKYEKPFFDAYTEGRNKISTLMVNDEETGTLRKATAEDFDSIMRLNDDEAAAAKIEELFGTGVKALMAANAREKAATAFGLKNKALDEFRAKGSEFEKLRGEQMKKQSEEVAKIWSEEKSSGADRHPHLFKTIENDNTGNSILEDGYRLADLAFGALDAENAAKLPQWVKDRMVNGNLPPQELAKLHAAVRNKAGAFDRLAFQNKQYKSEIETLKKKLSGLQASEPSDGEKGRKKQQGTDPIADVFSQLERMAR